MKTAFRLLVLAACVVMPLRPAAFADDGAQRGPAVRSIPRVPMQFEANHGQAPAGVDFVSRGRGYRVSLERGEAVVRLEPSADERGPALLRDSSGTARA